MRLRRLALVGSVACFAAAAALPDASADETPGAAFFGYVLSATAHGFGYTEDQPSANSHPESDGEVPESQARLAAGSGRALASVAWPGDLMGNLGSLVQLVNPDAPDEVQVLNYPVRAETSVGKPDVTNADVPGALMTASARLDRVTATSVLDGGEVGTSAGFGSTRSSSTVTLSADTAASVADSTTKDLSFGGVITIKSVVSHAEGRTDGTTATASGATSVSGMSVGGIPVTVDDNGVTVAGNNQPHDPVLQSTVNTLLQNAGMTIVLSKPTKEVDGGYVTYDAGSLVMVWMPPNNPSRNIVVMKVGGARVVSGATLADAAPPTSVPTLPPATPRPVQPPVQQPVSAPVADTPLPPRTDTPAAEPAPVTAPEAPLAVVPRALERGKGIPPAVAALTALGGLLLLAGTLQVPALVAPRPLAAHCPLEEETS